MWQKEGIKKTSELFSSNKKRFEIYTRDNPRKVIAAMFLILLIAVTALLVSRLFNRKGYGASLDRIYLEMESTNQNPKLAKRPTNADMLKLYELNGKMKEINPDSITAKDSLLLKEIESDLNKIIDEKN